MTFSDSDLHFGRPIFAVQPDDKILVYARSALWRLTADGHVDPTFPLRNIGPSFNIERMLPQANGKIILFGSPTIPGTPPEAPGSVGLTRRNADGATDTAFGDDGVVVLSLRGDRQVNDVEVTPGGSILASFRAVGELHVERYTPDGALDVGFGDGGVATVPLPNVAGAGATLHLLADGDILVPAIVSRGSEDGPFGSALARLNADGLLDENFPRLTPAVEFITNGVVTSSGKFVFPKDLTPNTFFDQDGLARMLLDDTSDGPVTVSDGVLDIDGTETPDRIRVTRFGDDLEVVRGDGLDRLIAVADVDKIDISALGGDDVVILAAGAIPSTVSGGDGHDRIAGGAGNDSLSGNAGNDRIDGGDGNDRVAGNGGRDKLAGSDGGDRLYGGAGADWLNGGSDDDTLRGDGGDDFIDGAFGNDFAHGDAGNDNFRAAGPDSGIDSIFGDGGFDLALLDPEDEQLSIEDDSEVIIFE